MLSVLNYYLGQHFIKRVVFIHETHRSYYMVLLMVRESYAANYWHESQNLWLTYIGAGKI